MAAWRAIAVLFKHFPYLLCGLLSSEIPYEVKVAMTVKLWSIVILICYVTDWRSWAWVILRKYNLQRSIRLSTKTCCNLPKIFVLESYLKFRQTWFNFRLACRKYQTFVLHLRDIWYSDSSQFNQMNRGPVLLYFITSCNLKYFNLKWASTWRVVPVFKGSFWDKGLE